MSQKNNVSTGAVVAGAGVLAMIIGAALLLFPSKADAPNEELPKEEEDGSSSEEGGTAEQTATASFRLW